MYGQRGYPPGAFVAMTVTGPLRGRILQEQGEHQVLWECDHAHRNGPEAAACAGQELGRTARL